MKKMKTNFPLVSFLIGLAVLLVGATGCIQENFDEPPVGGNRVELVPNTSIADLKATHVLGEVESITEDVIIEGWVIANDASGNFYKTLVIEDASGGIEVKINTLGLYNDYPEGQKVYIKCKGLFLGDYNRLVQLGGSSYEDNNGFLNVAGIEEALFPEHILKSEEVTTLQPADMTISKLTSDRVSTLVRLDNVQFASDEAGLPFADAVNRRSLNRTIEDCEGNTMVLRSSGYADFAETLLPQGKGSLVGVYSVFGTTPQLYIRDTYDVSMTGERCTGDGGGGNAGGGGQTVGAFSQDFASLANNQDVSIEGWMNVKTKGDRLWRAKEFSGNVYAQATAYQATEDENEMWLITPAIDLSQANTLSFESAKAFWNHDGLSVWISTNFDGSDVAGAEWTALEATIAGQNDDDHAWIPSGSIDLSSFSGKVYIGFKYTGSKNSGTTSYRIDNVKVE